MQRTMTLAAALCHFGAAVAQAPLQVVSVVCADTIPDMFRTAATVTGTPVLTALLPAEDGVANGR